MSSVPKCFKGFECKTICWNHKQELKDISNSKKQTDKLVTCLCQDTCKGFQGIGSNIKWKYFKNFLNYIDSRIFTEFDDDLIDVCLMYSHLKCKKSLLIQMKMGAIDKMNKSNISEMLESGKMLKEKELTPLFTSSCVNYE